MKLLKFFVVLLFILSAVSLFLGFKLFQKRELLKGRTSKLERAIIAVASLTEDSFADVEDAAFPARDIDNNIRTLIENPELSAFWAEYSCDLEQSAVKTVDLQTRMGQLANYYLIDPVTLKHVHDVLTGQKLTTGPGTMQELLDEVVDKAANQLNRLDETRTALMQTRTELVDSISDLNHRKNQLRHANTTVTKQKVDIAQLTDTVTERDNHIAILNQTVDDHDSEISDYQENVALLEENVSELHIKIEAKDVIIAKLRQPNPEGESWGIEPGAKGTVVSVSDDWNFVLININQKFIDQYLEFQNKAKGRPDLDIKPDLSIVRKDDGDIYVTKIRLSKVYPNKRLAIADVLPLWKQGTIRLGDKVVKF